MEKKTIHAQKAIGITIKSTLKTIAQDIGEWPMKLGAEINKAGLQMAGAPVYVYKGCDENPDTPFDLQMCFPVQDFSGYEGEFEKVELQEWTCLEETFQGSMMDLGPKGWTPFMTKVMDEKIKFTSESREVYVKWVDFNSPENQVLLQIGI